MSIQDLFETTATIQRAAESQETDGSLKEVWSDLIADVKCSIQALSASERAAYKKLEVVASFKMFILPQGTDITQKDRVVHNGRVFDIVFVDKWHLIAHHWKLILEESK